MRYLIPMLIGMLSKAMQGLVGRAMLALGMSFVTYTGISAGLGALITLITNQFRSIGEAAAFFVWMNGDKAVGMILATMSGVLALRLTSGALTKISISKAAST